MARGNNANRMRINSPSNLHTEKKNDGIQSKQLTIHRAIDRLWEALPKEASTFILSAPDAVNFHTLAEFWSSKPVIEYMRGRTAGGLCGASLFMALSYKKLGRFNLAR